jgi:hypothetical protein
MAAPRCEWKWVCRIAPPCVWTRNGRSPVWMKMCRPDPSAPVWGPEMSAPLCGYDAPKWPLPGVNGNVSAGSLHPCVDPKWPLSYANENVSSGCDAPKWPLSGVNINMSTGSLRPWNVSSPVRMKICLSVRSTVCGNSKCSIPVVNKKCVVSIAPSWVQTETWAPQCEPKWVLHAKWALPRCEWKDVICLAHTLPLQCVFMYVYYTSMPACRHAYMCDSMHACVHVCMCTCRHIYIYVCMQTCIHVWQHAVRYTCICVHMQAYIHLCRHTYIHLWRHTYRYDTMQVGTCTRM